MAAENSNLHTLKPPARFPSHHTATDIPPQARILCEIVATAPVNEVEARLSATQIQPEPETIQHVLKLSYNTPSAAAKFFRWAGQGQKLTGYSWNLMVDLLGKNKLFEPMWDAIRSMKQEGLLSLTTFVSGFENYCIAGRFDEAVMTFDVMEKSYGEKLAKDARITFSEIKWVLLWFSSVGRVRKLVKLMWYFCKRLLNHQAWLL